MSIFDTIHKMKVAEYRRDYKWYATADPKIRDNIIVRNFHLTNSQYERFFKIRHSVEAQYVKGVITDFKKFVQPFKRIK